MIAAIRCFSSGLACEAVRVPVLLSILRKPCFKSEWRARTALPKDVSATSSRISIAKGSRFYDFFPLFPTFHHFVTPFLLSVRDRREKVCCKTDRGHRALGTG